MSENQKILNTVVKGISENNNFIAKEYATKDELGNAVAATFRYCGGVKTYTSLASLTNVKAGDTYNIEQAGGVDDFGTPVKAGDNIVRTVDGKWDVQAGTTDLSNCVTKVAGKGLSANDFTDELKQKLEDLDDAASEELTDAQINAAVAAANPDIKINFYGDTAKAVTMINGNENAATGYTGLTAAVLSADKTKLTLTATTIEDGYPEEFTLNTAGTIATGAGTAKTITLNYTTDSVTVENIGA